MKQLFNAPRFGRVLLVAAMMLGPSITMGEEASQEAEARYQAAIQEAEARFQKRIDEARAEFLRDAAAARSLLEPARNPAKKESPFGDLPVTVVGADPVALGEGSDQTGWFEIPKAAQGAVIFQPRETEPKDGIVQFQVTRDSQIGLAASWAYDGNPGGGWQEDRLWKQDLIDKGWVEVGQMYLNLRDRHTLLVRQCKTDEVFAIRTRKYYRPWVYIPGVIPADQQPASKPQPVEDRMVEVVGAEKHATADFLPQVEGIPKVLDGTTIFASPLVGVAVLRVHQPGKVYVAASWDYDGNNSGQWTEERWSQEKFQEEGFQKIGTVVIKHRGTNQEHVLFVRECKKDDQFRLRSRKYGAPYVFVPSAT